MFLLLVTVILAIHGVFPLKLREVSVPAVVMRGDAVRLNCSFELEAGDKLYSVKWHKDSVEFYRYLPDDTPAGQKYHLEGIHLDLLRSKEGHIFMSHTDVHSEGIYRCEVSTDAPSFQTVKGEGEMRIYVHPSDNPRITGHKLRYRIGEEVNITCIAAPSRPPAFLKWYLNGDEVPVNPFMRYDPEETADGLFISRLGLRFLAERSHFSAYSSYEERTAAMELLCEAIIFQAHTLTSEEILVSQNATPGQYDKTSVRTFSSIPFEAGPIITGGHPHYRVGDKVFINCTGPKSLPPAELHWYINDKEVRQPNMLYEYPPERDSQGQEAYVLGLQFEVKQRHFPKGQPLRLRCTAAALSEVIRKRSQTIQIFNSNQRQQVSGLHVYEKSLAVSDSADKLHMMMFPLRSFFITLLLIMVL